MKGFIYLFVALFNTLLILNLINNVIASSQSSKLHDLTNSQLNKADSFEDNEEMNDDSFEYAELSPPELQAYLYGRSLKKGFNAWAGKRQIENLYRHLLNSGNKHEAAPMNRQRRKPWGGSA